MLSVRPLISPLNAADQLDRCVERIGERLNRLAVDHRFVGHGGEPADMLFIVSGGTEHLALEACAGDGPVLLLAHPVLNSLPAALEILARLRQAGRSGRIFLLGDAGADDAAISRLPRLVAARRRLRTARLGRIGDPSDWLVASAPSADAVATAWGPVLVDVPTSELVDAMRGADEAAAAAVRDAFVRAAAAIVEPSAADLDSAATVVLALRSIAERHRLDALTVRCFDLVSGARTTGCLALSWLLDAGIVAGCEGDVPSTVTMLWLHAVTGEPAFMANPQDLDAATATIALAHCTVARRLVSGYTLRSHFESGLGVGIEGTLAPGPVTLARIGGPDLRALFATDGEIVAGGAVAERCRTQVSVRLDDGVSELLARPLGNHHVLARGRHAAALREYHDLYVRSG